MAISFDAFLWALTQQESGGNYGALGAWLNMSYGRDRAYGRYQVMGANVGNWTAKYYGRRLTPQQFLNSRAAQDAVVRGRLSALVKQYGYRGAASAWYSGNASLHMSTRPQKGGPSIKGYVDSVMNRAASYKGGGGGGGYSVTSGTPPVTPTLDRAELAEAYGLSSALINSSKELKSLFGQAVAGNWSAALFQAKLKNTKWWKNQSSTLRKYVTLKFTDPATWKQNNQAAAAKVNAMAVQLGLGRQISPGGTMSKILREAVYNSVALGWSDARLKDWMGARVGLHGNIMWGEAGQAFDKLHETAYLNGLSYGKDWFRRKATDIVAGRTTVETVQDQLRNDAAGRYSAYAEQIRAGQNALDLAAPYIKSTATILELPETDIDLFNKHIAGAMTAKPAAGAPGTQKPLWMFENELREDPLWKKTNNARESMLTVARSVAKDFGLAW